MAPLAAGNLGTMGKAPYFQKNKQKSWLYGISGGCVPQGDHRYVTSFPFLDLNEQEEG